MTHTHFLSIVVNEVKHLFKFRQGTIASPSLKGPVNNNQVINAVKLMDARENNRLSLIWQKVLVIKVEIEPIGYIEIYQQCPANLPIYVRCFHALSDQA